MVLAEKGDKEIVKPVIVRIAGADTLSPAITEQAGVAGNRGEGAVLIVSVELIAGLLAGWKIFQGASRHEERVKVTVLIVVEQRHATAQGLDNVVFLVVAATVEGVGQPRFGGNVGELRGGSEHVRAE